MIDYLIIGNGVAGKKALETIRGIDKSGTITVVSDENHHFYYRPQLPEFIADKIEERSLFANAEDFYKKNNVETLFGVKATSVSPHKNQVVLENGNVLEYKKLLLAPGGRLKQKKYPGAEKTEDVIGLKTLNDAIAIKNKIKETKQVVIVGDSFFAAHLVKSFNERGVAVTYIMREGRLFPEIIDADASKVLEIRLQTKGIKLLKNIDIKEIAVRKGLIYGVKTTDDKFIECQLVGIADGLKPDIEFIKDRGIATGEGIFVDRNMRTNCTDIFAAGDAALLLNSGYSDMPQINIRWLKAWKQGIVSGRNMVGEDAVYDDVECYASTQVYDTDLVSIGISNPMNGKYKIMRGEYPHPDIDVYKKLVLFNEKIVGALLVGDVREASAIMKAIIEEKMVSEIDKKLLKQMFDMNYRLSPYRGIICPVCKLEILLDPNLKEGDMLNCPACGIDIKLTKERMSNIR